MLVQGCSKRPEEPTPTTVMSFKKLDPVAIVRTRSWVTHPNMKKIVTKCCVPLLKYLKQILSTKMSSEFKSGFKKP